MVFLLLKGNGCILSPWFDLSLSHTHAHTPHFPICLGTFTHSRALKLSVGKLSFCFLFFKFPNTCKNDTFTGLIDAGGWVGF